MSGINFRIYVTAFTACVGGLLFGYDTGFIGSAVQMESFQRDYDMNASNKANVKSNVVATLQAGCFFGTIGMCFITGSFGRKKGMAVCALIFCIGAILQFIVVGNRALLYTGRAISGLGVGGASMITPTYLSEVSPREIRGKLGTAYGCSIFFGILISYWIDYGCERGLDPNGHNQWRVPMALQLVPGALLLFGSFVLKESPRWLIKAGRREEGLASLSYVRKASPEDPVLQQEFQDICFSIEQEMAESEGASIKELWEPKYRIRVLIGFTVMVCQQFGGTNALTYYAPLLFEEVGLSGTSSSLFATGIYGIVKTVCSLIFMFVFAERLGRRLPLFMGACGMFVCFLIVALVLATCPVDPNAASISSASVAMMVFIYLFCVCYAMSWGPIPFTYVSEIYPTRIRDYCVAMGLATQWAFNYVISRIVPIAMDSIGWRTFLMFAIFNAAIAIFVFLVVRETRGVALEQMDDIFSTGLLMKPSQWNLNMPKSTAVIDEELEMELGRERDAKIDAGAHLETVKVDTRKD
ncbi:general substrate transporter [Myxozyma melibiosi]|uniref:General substrate transporter n=1 Tax=Myxozyma melibiosi TaxID=54550 RepID=A0ABR1EYQ0_9ASCO